MIEKNSTLTSGWGGTARERIERGFGRMEDISALEGRACQKLRNFAGEVPGWKKRGKK